MLELIAIHYSPWSEKARWALDHFGLPYEETQYLPMIGELALRRRLGRWRGTVSVPILFADGAVVGDSFQIAKFLDERHGQDAPLFPEAFRDEIVVWNDRSEAGLAAGRAIATQRVVDDPAARREAMPAMPSALVGPLTTPLTGLGIRYLRRKYGFSEELEGERATLAEMLETLSETLADGREFLLGDAFSYADICMAVSLQFVRPVTDEYIKLRPASRQAYTDEALCAQHERVLAWRDKLYQSHRRP